MLITESKIPFIIFIDGADGVGKTTVAVELANLISSKGINTGIESILGCTTIANLIKEKAINDEDHNEYLNFLGFCYSTFTGSSFNRSTMICSDSRDAVPFPREIRVM
jgi:cytidylate kinase